MSVVLDGHIHILQNPEPKPEEMATGMREAGVSGGVVISLPPPSFPWLCAPRSTAERVDNLFAWCEAEAEIYPFFWIDPIAENAAEEVAMAVERGVAGFKVMCNTFFAGDDRAMETFRAIAGQDRPILFHSGILFDGSPSSPYNRPAAFESLLEVAGLRFALAHISWPWCDECIAVYGKFQNAHLRRPDLDVEMFIDTTPGTPKVYRREVLTKLFSVGYDIKRNVLFGTDCRTHYDPDSVREWLALDDGICEDLGLGEDDRQCIFGENLRRFVRGARPPAA